MDEHALSDPPYFIVQGKRNIAFDILLPPSPSRFSTTFADMAVVNLVRLRIFESEFFSRKRDPFFFFFLTKNKFVDVTTSDGVITYNYIYVVITYNRLRKYLRLIFFFFEKERLNFYK